MPNHHHDFSKTLSKAGFKVTPPRVAILESLAKAPSPQSADALFESLNGVIDRVTLYRNLKALSEKGILYQTDFRTGKSLFELQDACQKHPHHHHVVCTNCGRIEHIADCIGSAVEKRILAQSKSFRIFKSHMLEFFGICTRCERAHG